MTYNDYIAKVRYKALLAFTVGVVGLGIIASFSLWLAIGVFLCMWGDNMARGINEIHYCS